MVVTSGKVLPYKTQTPSAMVCCLSGVHRFLSLHLPAVLPGMSYANQTLHIAASHVEQPLILN